MQRVQASGTSVQNTRASEGDNRNSAAGNISTTVATRDQSG